MAISNSFLYVYQRVPNNGTVAELGMSEHICASTKDHGILTNNNLQFLFKKVKIIINHHSFFTVSVGFYPFLSLFSWEHYSSAPAQVDEGEDQLHRIHPFWFRPPQRRKPKPWGF